MLKKNNDLQLEGHVICEDKIYIEECLDRKRFTKNTYDLNEEKL